MNNPDKSKENIKKAYVAGGCFWGMEELFRKQTGVVDTRVGYSGGENENPTYENHPGHAEALEISYDSTKTSFEDILDYFFRIHDPTTQNRQGNDVGSSYRSAIFYQNNDEKNAAENFISKVNDSGRWDKPVVTSLEKFEEFYSAEEYHQDYLQKNPGGYTCHVERFGEY
jgi:peptide-methionine (S)-S-oxide reductase